MERLGRNLWKGETFSLMQGQGKELGAAFHGAKTQLVDDSQMLGSWGTKSVVWTAVRR